VLVPVIELWRIAVLGRGEDLAVAIAATAAYLPLHVRHVSSGLQGRRPRGGVTTLAVMTAVIVGAWSLIGQQWVFMFASLAVSMLCALPTRYALPAAAAAVLWPLAYDWSPPITDDVYSGPYLSLSLRSAFTVHPARQYCPIPLRWAAIPLRHADWRRRSACGDMNAHSSRPNARRRGARCSSADRGRPEVTDVIRRQVV
jgi:hypothetical protein